MKPQPTYDWYVDDIQTKPGPPADLWEALDKAASELGIRFMPRPPNGFTIAEYAERFGMGHRAACDRIKKLEAAGKIKYLGTGTKGCKYYVLA